MKAKLVSALAGGFFAGLISCIPIVGWIWFVWAILGGCLAVFLFYRKVGPAIEVVDGLLIGGIAGLIGGVANLVGVGVISLISSAIGALLQSGSADPLASFSMSVVFSLFGIGINIVFSILMVFISLISGLLLALILRSTSRPQAAPPVNPFNQSGR